ncbi:crossover junction endonuclease EME1B isoform X2 [Asparagus officinalis]|uniref:crossover junction endonuclease EME1B isoform X2 n=1 Tax=Asparagus officinalis TaxID=4686 RepID=UPI00098DEF45|nr:crossover junction endonuclease EME1B isoform X2 [Asparagus officinalis]
MDRPPPMSIDIISDDDISSLSPTPLRPAKRPNSTSIITGEERGGAPPTLLVIDVDDPTPHKQVPRTTPSFVADTPLSSSDVSIVKCSLRRPQTSEIVPPSNLQDKFAGVSGFICLESDDESEDGSCKGNFTTQKHCAASFGLVGCSAKRSSFSRSPSPMHYLSEKECIGICSPLRQETSANNEDSVKVTARCSTNGLPNGCMGATSSMQGLEDNPHVDCMDEDVMLQVRSYNDEAGNMFEQVNKTIKQKGKRASSESEKNNKKSEIAARKKTEKEEKTRMLEEKKRKRQEEKFQRDALKAEAAEKKKLEKEKQKWEKGKLAVKSIVAEIDAKVVENGSVGGHLLTRLAEKGLSFRITSNPIERSILWQMSVPDQIAQISSVRSEVPYVLLVYQAEEFCELVRSDSLMDNVRRVQSFHPSFTVCYLTNKLMSYINKCEQNQYKNPSHASSWTRPPVEEVLSKLTTHYTKVHSRQCIDEAELAEHIVGLTSSLASCQFRLKALVAIPKVQPRYAIAIWKRYPTMRSLLNVYMDPNKSVHEKEFLLKDLMLEGLLGKEDRRLGEMCSKRIYRILMAQSGGIKTDDVEDGADSFGC